MTTPSKDFLDHLRSFPYKVEAEKGLRIVRSSNGSCFVDNPSFLEHATVRLTGVDVPMKYVKDLINVCFDNITEVQSCSCLARANTTRVNKGCEEVVGVEIRLELIKDGEYVGVQEGGGIGDLRKETFVERTPNSESTV